MSGNSRDRRLVRRSHQRAGARVPNTYRRLADKGMVLGVAERWAEYESLTRYQRTMVWLRVWLRSSWLGRLLS